MLWDLVRDFFVHNVFGGVDSVGAIFGGVVYGDRDSNPVSILECQFHCADYFNGEEIVPQYVNMADWLSTTATAISITIIVVLCCLFVYKIVRLIGGLIR